MQCSQFFKLKFVTQIKNLQPMPINLPIYFFHLCFSLHTQVLTRSHGVKSKTPNLNYIFQPLSSPVTWENSCHCVDSLYCKLNKMPTPLFNMTSFNTTTERVAPVDPARAHVEALEVAGKAVEKQMSQDSNFPFLKDRMRITPQSESYFIYIIFSHVLLQYSDSTKNPI